MVAQSSLMDLIKQKFQFGFSRAKAWAKTEDTYAPA